MADLARILLKYPTRERPKLFRERVQNWRTLAACPDALQWLVTIDENDPAGPAVKRYCEAEGLPCYSGPRTTKVGAINRDMEKAQPWDILILISDDMEVTLGPWDRWVREDYARHFPDFNGALWYPDGRQRRLCTLSIMGRPVYHHLGHIYHPDYHSVYCDDWYQLEMQRTNRLRFIDRRWIRHAWREGNNDALMEHNEALASIDRATFQRMCRERNP